MPAAVRLQVTGHAGSMINADQCRIKFVALTPMPINKYQCRLMKINTDQYFSIQIDPYLEVLVGMPFEPRLVPSGYSH